MELRFKNLWTVAVLILGSALLLMGCTGAAASGTDTAQNKPLQIEEVAGSKYDHLRLTDRAVERLDLRTVPAGELTVPYGALIYGLHGETYVYLNPEPLLFIREPVKLDRVDGDTVYLTEGPSAGTLVVSLGAAELYGAENGVGK